MYPINISICTILFLLICRVFIVLYGVLTLYCTIVNYCVFETCKMKSVLKLLYFERYSFTFHFTKFLSHFLNKLMLNRNYFLILSLVKKSFHHCVYILSRNREKQLCNKAIKSHTVTEEAILKACVYKKHCNTIKTVTVNRSKTVLFLNFN